MRSFTEGQRTMESIASEQGFHKGCYIMRKSDKLVARIEAFHGDKVLTSIEDGPLTGKVTFRVEVMLGGKWKVVEKKKDPETIDFQQIVSLAFKRASFSQRPDHAGLVESWARQPACACQLASAAESPGQCSHWHHFPGISSSWFPSHGELMVMKWEAVHRKIDFLVFAWVSGPSRPGQLPIMSSLSMACSNRWTRMAALREHS